MILAILWNDSVFFVDFGLLQFYDKSIPLKELTPNIINWNEFVEKINKEK